MARKAGGVRFVATVVALDLLLLAVLRTSLDVDLEALAVSARWTARYAVVWFLGAFTASALVRRWPGPVTRWILERRRWIGVSFAITLYVHLGVLVEMAWRWPDEFLGAIPIPSLVVGGTTYAFVLAQALTSNDAAVRWLGAARWRRLHLIGSHLVWLALLLGTVPRALQAPPWWALTVAIGALVPLRIRTRSTRRDGRSA